MLNRNSVESKALSSVRLVLALLIVFIHTNYQSGIGDDLYRFFCELISGKIAIIAVPCFFMISGYLFYVNKEFYGIHEFKIEINKKFKSLFVPYVLWCLLGYITIHAVRYKNIDVMPWDLFKIFWNGYDVYNVTSVLGYSFAPITVPYGNSVLWFVRDLMIVMVFSHPLYHLLRRFGLWVVVVLFVCRVFYIGLPIPGVGLDAFFFFSLGAYFSVKKMNVVKWIGERAVLLLLLWLGGAFLYKFHNSAFDVLYQIMGASSIISIVYLLTNRNGKLCSCLLFWSESTFFVYVVHNMSLFVVLTKPILHVFMNIPHYGCTLGYIFVTFFKFVLCVCLYFFLKSKSPKLLSVLVGGRINK